jgi:hypothetical protein
MKYLIKMTLSALIIMNVFGFGLTVLTPGNKLCAHELVSPVEYAKTADTKLGQFFYTGMLGSMYFGVKTGLYLLEKPGKCD